jgi:arginine utilization protein RocB/arginine deiminase
MSIQNLRWYSTVKTVTEQLMSIPTISPDVAGENRCAEEICRLLTQPDSQGQSPDLQPELWATGDGRYSVACLLRGKHPSNQGDTIILMGHFDIVGVNEYAGLLPEVGADIAYQPDRLREVLQRSLKPGTNADVMADLMQQWTQDGETHWTWMFGRGSVDMKSGVAIIITILRELWKERQNLAGNVLVLACPDEENESAGVISAGPKLLELAEREGLRYLGVINTDYTAPRGSDESERYIYTGVVGKLLPSFYVLGNPTHVGEPFRGIDANQIAAELVRRLNLNTRLSDYWPRDGGQAREVAAPPVTLKLKDLKPSYNVQTSSEAFLYINWLTYSLSPAQAMEICLEEAGRAIQGVLDEREAEISRYKGQQPRLPEFRADVIDFEALCYRVRERKGMSEETFSSWLNDLAAQISAEEKDAREMSRAVVAKLAQEADLTGPAVVVFFSPPYYPHIQPEESQITDALQKILSELPDDHPIQLRGFYPYIADLSYMRLDETVRPQIGALIQNMPLFGRGYSLDFDTLAALNCPVVNIGPFGKEAHGLYERIHMPYSFEVAPQLIYETIQEIFGQREKRLPEVLISVQEAQAASGFIAQNTDLKVAGKIDCQIDSEFDTLKTTLVHRPGAEIDRLMLDNKTRLLFEDIPFLKRMKVEHDAFCRLMRDQGVQVVYVEDLLTDVFNDPAGRESLLMQMCGQPEVAHLLAGNFNSDELTEIAFAGITTPELQARTGVAFPADNLEEFLIEPIPNTYFTRDPAAIIHQGFVSCKAQFDARVRETVMLRALFQHHPALKDTPRIYGEGDTEDRPYTIEGGDITVLNEKAVIVGCSQRTRSETVAMLARKLFALGQAERVYEVSIPVARLYMHLDTVFTILAPGIVVAYPSVMDNIPEIRRYEPHISTDGDIMALPIREDRDFNRILEDEFGMPITVVNTGNNDARYAAREQGADGTNIFAIAPGKVISYDRNVHTNKAMRALGLEVLEVEGSELVRGLGGPRCMTMPLKRVKG